MRRPARRLRSVSDYEVAVVAAGVYEAVEIFMRIAGNAVLITLALAAWLAFDAHASAQLFKPMRKASELISRQDPPKVFKEVEPVLTKDNAHVMVSLSKQRVYGGRANLRG